MYNLRAAYGSSDTKLSDAGPPPDLNGYEEIVREDWLKVLTRGDFIRYLKTNGKHAEGYVSTKSDTREQFIILSDITDPNSFKTIINASSIQKIWRRIRGGEVASNVQSIARIVSTLGKKVIALEELSELRETDPQLMEVIGKVASMEARIASIEYNVSRIHETLAKVVEALNGPEDSEVVATE